MSELRFNLLGFGHLAKPALRRQPARRLRIGDIPRVRALIQSALSLYRGDSWGASRPSTANLNCICADGLVVLFRAGYGEPIEFTKG
jgi:hypothetical protein